MSQQESLLFVNKKKQKNFIRFFFRSPRLPGEPQGGVTPHPAPP